MTRFLAAALALVTSCANANFQARDLTGDGIADAYFDSVQNVSWLADASYYLTTGGALDLAPHSMPPDHLFYLQPGQVRLANALSWVDALVIGGISDWRLPRRLIQQGDPTGTNMYCTATYCMPNLNWPSELSVLQGQLAGDPGPFSNVVSGGYMTYNNAPGSMDSWWVEWVDPLGTGGRSLLTDETAFVYGYLWAVHDGDVGAGGTAAPIPEPSTYALMALGLVAVVVRTTQRRQADPLR